MKFGKISNEDWTKYLHIAMVVFGTFVMCILVFFFIFRFNGVAKGFSLVFSALMPFLYGAVFAYLLRSPCDFLERKILERVRNPRDKKTRKRANAISVTVNMVLALGIVYLLLFVILASVIGTVADLATTLPDTLRNLTNQLEGYFVGNEMVINYISTASDALTQWVDDWLNADLIPNMTSLINGVSTGVFGVVTILKNVIIGIIISIYMLLSRRQIKAGIKRVIHAILPNGAAKSVLSELHFTDKVFNGFVTGRLLDSAIVGIICYVALVCLKMPDAMLIALIVGVTNIIPFFGPFIGAVPSAIIVLVGDPSKLLIFLIFIVILQQLDGNILDPKIIGDRIGLSSFWVLFAILLFGGLFGFAGMLFGVPVFAVAYDIVGKLMNIGLEHNGKAHMIPKSSDDD